MKKYRSDWFDCHGYLACTVIENGKKKTVFQHREIVENHLGRPLTRREVVHHRNSNRKDNRIENLKLMTLSGHSKIHGKGIEWVSVTCLQCKKVVIKQAKEERARKAKGRTGPFCSKKCVGKWFRKTGSPGLSKNRVNIEYIKKALSEGKSLREIGRNLGVNHTSILYQKRKLLKKRINCRVGECSSPLGP